MKTLTTHPIRPDDRSDSDLCELVSQLKGSPPKKVIDEIGELLDDAPMEEAARALEHEPLRRCAETLRLAIHECGRQSSIEKLIQWIRGKNKCIEEENKTRIRRKKKLAGNRQLVYLTA